MAKNPFKLPGIPKVKQLSSLPSDRALSPTSAVMGPEQPVDPEARKARFRRLAGILGGLRKS